MKTGRALVAGAIGGLVTIVLVVFAAELGFDLHVPLMLGSMLGLSATGAGTWLAGVVVHLVLASVVALGYALAFEYVAHRAGAIPGIVFSLLHVLIAGVVIGTLPALHPLVPDVFPAPGAFFARYGRWAILAFLGLHALYGAVVGEVYGTVIHPARRPVLGRPFDDRPFQRPPSP